ncbi:hypothetical protein EV715DRAFT_198144 [Schizophyllum commune]
MGRSYWVKYSLPDPCAFLSRTAGTFEVRFSICDHKTYASEGYKVSEADHIGLYGVDILLERVAKAIAQVPRGITVELHVSYPKTVEVEYATLDFLLEQLVFIPGWHHLQMSFPGRRPLHLGKRERETEGGFLARKGGKSRLIAALAGKHISFRGSRTEVPAPWFSLRALTRYGVASVNLCRNVTPQDWRDLCYSSGLEVITPFQPLELSMDAIVDVPQPHEGDARPTHAKPDLHNLLHPDSSACRLRTLNVRANKKTWKYVRVDKTSRQLQLLCYKLPV